MRRHSAIIVSAIKGIDGIWEWRGTAAPASSRPFYMAATERGPPNMSTPFVAGAIRVLSCPVCPSLLPLRQTFRLHLAAVLEHNLYGGKKNLATGTKI